MGVVETLAAVCEARLGRALTDAERDALGRRAVGADAAAVGRVATMELATLAGWIAG
jgi:hypothetical protein